MENSIVALVVVSIVTGSRGRMDARSVGLLPSDEIAPISAQEPSMFFTPDFCHPWFLIYWVTSVLFQLGVRKLAVAGSMERNIVESISIHRMFAATGNGAFAVAVESSDP